MNINETVKTAFNIGPTLKSNPMTDETNGQVSQTYSRYVMQTKS